MAADVVVKQGSTEATLTGMVSDRMTHFMAKMQKAVGT